ncbi:MepB family protein [Sphingobacterium multivorum]|uniref:MepB family protein n=1 Tax=Sphingobacterium multivorum TaxID=28454 RepID=UPI0035E3C28B
MPFTADDPFDYYLILVEQDQHCGLFVFPKQALIEHEILTAGCQEGKRGFRIYPDWSIPTTNRLPKANNGSTHTLWIAVGLLKKPKTN